MIQKTIGTCYWDELLMKELLQAIQALQMKFASFSRNVPADHHVKRWSCCFIVRLPNSAANKWPSSSLDFNLFDYHICGVVHKWSYHPTSQDVADLQQRLMRTWAGFQQSSVAEAVDEWKRRLCLSTRGHFEHLLWHRLSCVMWLYWTCWVSDWHFSHCSVVNCWYRSRIFHKEL